MGMRWDGWMDVAGMRGRDGQIHTRHSRHCPPSLGPHTRKNKHHHRTHRRGPPVAVTGEVVSDVARNLGYQNQMKEDGLGLGLCGTTSLGI